ncbi:MAG: polysaccharide deacetylase family protein [Holdemanella sp.]|nr:polysaccharide deacetylase family protein [Holdemanella sp.]
MKKKKRRVNKKRIYILTGGLILTILLLVLGIFGIIKGVKSYLTNREIKKEAERIAQRNSPEALEHYKTLGVNELGELPIFMYHGIYDMKDSETEYTGGNVDVDGYSRTAESFKKDLERLYDRGYYLIRLEDYLNGIIDVPEGKSPAILTFDDGGRNAGCSELDKNGDPIFDKNCAIDVLEQFKKDHPDTNVTATFFLNSTGFDDSPYNKEVLEWMIENGYDIGSHTISHANLSQCDAKTIQEQVGGMQQILEEWIPGKWVKVLAKPYGEPVSLDDDPVYEYIKQGSYNGIDYTVPASLLCSWTNQESVFASTYDPHYIKRIRAYDAGGANFDIEYNLNLLTDDVRYISDGDKDTIVYPKNTSVKLGNSFDKQVITY